METLAEQVRRLQRSAVEDFVTCWHTWHKYLDRDRGRRYSPTWDSGMRDERDSVTFLADFARADHDPGTWASNAGIRVDWAQAARDAQARRDANDARKGKGKDKDGGRDGPPRRPHADAGLDRNPRHRAR